MPESHQSSLLNRSELGSQLVSDKHNQWSDSGPIKMIIEKINSSVKWPTRLREKDWMRVKALIRLETFSEPLVWEVMPLAAGRWKHLRDQRVDSASFFSSFLEGSGGYHSTSTIAPQANNLSVKGRPFPLGYVQRQQCRNCLVVGLALAQRGR